MSTIAQRTRVKKSDVEGVIVGVSPDELAFERALKGWVRGRLEYEDVVKAVPSPSQEEGAMVKLGRKVRKVLRRP